MYGFGANLIILRSLVKLNSTNLLNNNKSYFVVILSRIYIKKNCLLFHFENEADGQ